MCHLLAAVDTRSYFDINGSTPLDAVVRDALLQVSGEAWGNPSASHPEGRRARVAIDQARSRIAQGLGVGEDEVWLTSGGTESNNWALQGAFQAAGGRRRHLVVSAIEHRSVLRTAEALVASGCDCSLVPVPEDGRVRLEDVERVLRPDTFLVSLMLANNETGVLQPVAEVARVCRERGILSHCDAVAAVGKIPIDVTELECDLLSVSGHKLYAPKGTGVLVLRRGALEGWPGAIQTCSGLQAALPPLIHGCGQQQGLRGGTENTAGVVALGVAFERMRQGAFHAERLGPLRDRLWKGLQALDPTVARNGAGSSLPNTLSVHFPGRPGADLQARLGEHGVSVAVGAAATNGAASHVLLAMGLTPERARSTLRFSLGAHHDEGAVDHLLDVLREVLQPEPRPEPTR